MSKQPFFKKYSVGGLKMKNCDIIHECGLYVPNNPDLTEQDISRVVDVING